MDDRNRMFKERRDVVVNALKKIGISVEMPKATFYVWAGVPEGVTDSKQWCMTVLNEIAVWMIPGSMYGRYGEGFFRIALQQQGDPFCI
jgi:LL-diaminopimelate aminotransferase